MGTSQEVEMLRRQLDVLTTQMIEIRQQSSSTAMNAAVSGLAKAVKTMGQSVSKPRPKDMRVGKPESYAPAKICWNVTFNGYAGTLDPACLALLKTARQSPTLVMADSTTRTAVCNIAVPPHDPHTERSTESGEKSWKHRFRTLQTIVPDVRNVRSGGQHGTISCKS